MNKQEHSPETTAPSASSTEPCTLKELDTSMLTQIGGGPIIQNEPD